jgi:hypothetical protein
MAMRHRRAIEHHHHGARNVKPRPSGVIPESHVDAYDVNGPGWEAIVQDFYDSQAYAAAGETQMTFFQESSGNNTNGLAGTNMQLQGQIPAMQKLLVESVEIDFFPTIPAVTAQNPATYGAPAIAQIVNDVYAFRQNGYLQFNVGSKYYLQSGPLKKFPSRQHFSIDAALSDASTAVTNGQSRIAFADVVGKEYKIAPYSVLLIANQNFDVTLNWPAGKIALPSGNPANVYITLWGILYRRSQ